MPDGSPVWVAFLPQTNHGAHQDLAGRDRQRGLPRLDAARGFSSAAGDTSEGSTAGLVLRSIDEISQLDEESLEPSQIGVVVGIYS